MEIETMVGTKNVITYMAIPVPTSNYILLVLQVTYTWMYLISDKINNLVLAFTRYRCI